MGGKGKGIRKKKRKKEILMPGQVRPDDWISGENPPKATNDKWFISAL